MPIACHHCGSEVPPDHIRPGDDKQYCCRGCRTVAGILREHHLDDFYRMRSALGTTADTPTPSDASLDTSRGALAWPAEHIETINEHHQRMTCWVGGIHCAACVWLLERVSRVTPGVLSARLAFGEQRLTVDFDPTQTDPMQVAHGITKLGYQPQPWQDGDGTRHRLRERRHWYARTAIAAGCAFGTMHLTWSVYAGEHSGDMQANEAQFFGFLALLVATPAVFWSGAPFFRGAIGGLRAGRITIDLTTALVLVVGYIISAIHLLLGSAEIYFDAVTMFVAFLLGGRLVFLAARDRVAASGDALNHILPTTAERVSDNTHQETETVPANSLRVGDIIRVERDTTIPADGTVIDNALTVDAAILTGESRPVVAQVGSTVFAGCRAQGPGSLTVTSSGAHTRIGELLADIRAGTASPSSLTGDAHQSADRLQAWFAPIVLGMAALTAAAWWRADPAFAWAQAVAVILVACPCALGLAAPSGVRTWPCRCRTRSRADQRCDGAGTARKTNRARGLR